VTSVGEKEEKTNTIQPPFLCFSHLKPRQRRSNQNWHWGPKLPQMQNLGGRFVVFFLRGPKSQLCKS